MPEPSLADIIAGRSKDHRVMRSPGGGVVMVIQAIEAFNSQWVEAGTLYRAADLTLVAQIGEWNWHIDRLDWQGDDAVTLALRRWPGDAPALSLTLDLNGATARPADSTETVPLAELSAWLELWYQMHRKRG